MMKRRGWLVLLLTLGVLAQMHAQDRYQKLNELKTRLVLEDQQRLQRVEAYLTTHSGQEELPIGKNGQKAYIYDVINGKPVYVASDNFQASRNVGVTQLRSGGSLGLNLRGQGMGLHIWEGPGGALSSHVEFGGRITNGSDYIAGDEDNHSTHVTGTVLSGGTNNQDATGMAPDATALVYDFNGDISEIATELGNDPDNMILSNHSYGTAAGWTRLQDGSWRWEGDDNISETEDWKFGFYNSRARAWDEFIYNAPYYLMVTSAGNHRSNTGDGTRPADGPYEIVVFEAGAKNIVSVGATQKFSGDYTGPEDIQMSTFSSWGPTDDGRIKPDITAPGVAVFSTGAGGDENYITLQGTSMSSPVVMGSLSLIQQLSRELTGGFMPAAALKALMLHSAHEAGVADGPDYRFGWGLINAEGMAELLLQENDDNIDLVLDGIADGETKSYTITPRVGTRVKLTLVWTDVPGNPVAVQLDPTDLMLVNDLDMRAEGATDTQMPWILDPANPEDAATKGDNFRDNVEKIEFDAVDGSYTVNITHKNAITDGPQDYALVIEYVTESDANTLYWVGNSGNWSDGANWSTTSGGEATNRIPTANDLVIFDNNSFSGLGEEENFAITLTENAEVAQLRWFAEKTGTVDFAGNQLTSNGSVVVLSEAVDLSGGTVNLSVSAEGAIINVQSPVNNADIKLMGAATTTFDVLGDITANSIELVSGILNVGDKTMSVGDFKITDGQLLIAGSTMNISSSFEIADETPEITWTSSRLIVPSGAVANIDLSGTSIPIDMEVEGTATIGDPATIQSLVLTETININGDLTLDNMGMAAGSTTNIANGTTLTVNADFTPSGADGSLVNIASDGTAELGLVGHRKVCVDFINVAGVNYNGQSTLSIGTNSQLAGSETGWVQRACDDVLFADFNLSFGCANGLSFFQNTSSGNILSNTWNFGESAPGTVDSEESDPTYRYNTAGDYDVVLTVTDSEGAFELTSRTTIIDNTITGFNILNQQGILVSERAGGGYQWYKDGQPIEGETFRQFEATEAGTYSILVFDAPCNRFSNDFEFTVTSIDVDPLEQQKVERALTIFPNPTRDYIDISIDGYDLRNLSIDLIDPSGKVVTSSTHERVNSQSFTSRINVADKGQGFYILRFLVNDGISINKKVILMD